MFVQDQLSENSKEVNFFSLRSMLEAKAFLLFPAELGVLISLKHTKEARQRPYFASAFGVFFVSMRMEAFHRNAQPQKELLRSTGFGESTNKYRLAKWIAKRIACWNIWYQQALLATTTFAFEHLQPVNYAVLKLKP